MQTETRKLPDGILARLKAETLPQHQNTEDTVDLMREDFTLEEYKNLLMRFYGFYKPFEAKMREAIGENPIELNHDERLNTPRLEQDLKHFGLSDEEISNIRLSENLPELSSQERIFGSLYVIEGSTLGGQVISRHLKQKFDIDAENGAAFFSGYCKETGTMWKSFGEAITNFAEQSENHDEIINGAKDTFEKIGKSLEK